MLSRRMKRGAMTVEFALVCPIFVLLVFGMIEFSRVSIIRHAVDNAAYEGARVGIIPGANVTDVATAAQRHLDAVGLSGATINVTPNPLNDLADDVTVQVIVLAARGTAGHIRPVVVK